jgi:hypothetical protein
LVLDLIQQHRYSTRSIRAEMGQLSIEELREGFSTHFHMSLSPEQIEEFVGKKSDPVVDHESFVKGVGIKAVLQDVN